MWVHSMYTVRVCVYIYINVCEWVYSKYVCVCADHRPPASAQFRDSRRRGLPSRQRVTLSRRTARPPMCEGNRNRDPNGPQCVEKTLFFLYSNIVQGAYSASFSQCSNIIPVCFRLSDSSREKTRFERRYSFR